MFEQLQKTLSQAGYGSHEDCDEFITAGRVRVNGQIATFDEIVDPAIDKITIDGAPISAATQITRAIRKHPLTNRMDIP